MARRRHGHTPRFPLAQIQELVAWGRFRLTRSARRGAQLLDLDDDDVAECISQLTERDYEQTLAGERFPGTFQDVYKPRFYIYEIYLKVQIEKNIEVVVISFKRNTSA